MLTRSCIALALLAPIACCAAGIPDADGNLVVVRGIGWSPWHATEGWHHSEETRELDRKLLAEAHVNTLRTWGAWTPESAEARLADGYYVIPTIHAREGARAEFAGGAPGRDIAPSDPGVVGAFADRVAEEVGKFRGRKAPLCFLLGNEYSGVGQNPANSSYQYLGFEAATQARFRQWLKQRFNTVERVNRHCGTGFGSWKDVQPLANRRFRYEWWLFLNQTFEDFMRAGHQAAKAASPAHLTSYAKLMGTHWDPYTEDARLSFLDINGDNLYWHWVKDWARYQNFIDDLVAAAEGKPVLFTEGGFQSLVLGEERAGRLTKQMLWSAFMHPQTAGFCVYAYSDEWYVDGNDKEQSPSESWGVVTADRRPKATYHAMAEVYRAVRELEGFFAGCQAEPLVAVSNQALGARVEDASTKLHTEIARVLYSDGVPLKSIMPADVHSLSVEDTPRLVFCDALFDCQPDGSRSAIDAFLRYVMEGGKVLYLSSKPWRQTYGETHVAAALRMDVTRPEGAMVRYGKGSIRFIPRDEFETEDLRCLLTDFLEATGGVAPVRVELVRPSRHRNASFCRLLTNKGRRILIVMNAADEPLDVLDIAVRGATGVRSLFSDGGALSQPRNVDGALRFRLRDVDTYALVEVNG